MPGVNAPSAGLGAQSSPFGGANPFGSLFQQQAGMTGAAAQEAQDAEGLLNGNHARSSDAVFTLDDEEDDNSGL